MLPNTALHLTLIPLRFIRANELGRYAQREASMISRWIFMLVFFLFLHGCSVIGRDEREKIAMASIYDGKGNLDERAFSAALNAKPGLVGFPSSSLSSFVESLGGKCATDSPQSMFCKVPQSETFCVASFIALIVKVDNGIVRAIEPSSRLTGC